MFKQLLTLAAACITFGASAATLWECEDANGVLVEWGKPCVALTAEEVAEAIVPGDYINVTTVGVNPENSWPQVALFGQFGGWPPLTNDGVGGKTYPYVSSFPVTNDIYNSIIADGLSISGDGAYVGKVEVVSSGVEVGPNTVWFGNKECGWGNGVSLPASLFEDVRPYDKLAFYVDGVGFQVLLGGWGGLNVPCYEFPDNVTYVDGVATYTLTKAYAEDGVLDQIKANGVIMHGTVTITRIDYIQTDILEETVGHATISEGWEDTPNYAPAADINVTIFKGNKVRLDAWAGVEGYDLIITYDDNWNITAITPVYNGAEDTTYTSGWAYLYTGNDNEYLTAYISEGYDMAGSEDGEGIVFLQGYLNNTDFMYYNVEWPLTAEELADAITAAYDEDIAQIQEWVEVYDGLQEEYAGYLATEAGENALSEIAQAIQEANNAVAEALEAAAESWGYVSPLTGEVVIEVNEYIIGVVADRQEFIVEIEKAAQADSEKLFDYANQLEELLNGVEASETVQDIAAAMYQKLLDLQTAIENAGNEALNVTGVYVSPLTDEVINELDQYIIDIKASGINAIEADTESATYFGINGQHTTTPAAGQMVIKVKNGKASKVLVK